MIANHFYAIEFDPALATVSGTIQRPGSGLGAFAESVLDEDDPTRLP
jgi:hypothetical protein